MRNLKMSNLKRVLWSLVVLGVLTTVVGASSFASFTAQTTNPSNTFAAGTLTMTNVAGTAVSGSDCATATLSGTCATLFAAGTAGTTGLTNFTPGGSDVSNTVSITYTGSLPTGDFRLYASSYAAKGAGSAALCTASNPASKLNLQVTVGATIIYPTTGSGYGTLDGFATTYTSAGTGLPLRGGTNGSGTAGVWATNDVGTYTINVNLDASADNTYQGCQSVAALNWYAGQ